MKDKKHLKELRRREKKIKTIRKLESSSLRIKIQDALESASLSIEEGVFEEALWSINSVLKVDPYNIKALNLGAYCAHKLDDDETLYKILRRGWPRGLISHKQNLVFFAELAVRMKDHSLASELLAELEQRGDQYEGTLTRKYEIILARLKQRLHFGTLKEAKKARPMEEGLKPKTEPAPPSTAASSGEKGQKAPEEEIQLLLRIEADGDPVMREIEDGRASRKEDLDLALLAYRISFQASYDELLCIPLLRGVEALWYQQETVRKVMRQFRGRAILADEVGLGKTIEASLVLKEYMVRGLVRTALILVPSSLVNQWKGELQDKFGLEFVSTNDELFRQAPDAFWTSPLVLASIQTARSKRHFESVTARSYDMVVVDEAHHLKSHTTVNWKLIDSLTKTFLLLLTATPVQNKLEELYNLVTLLKPGHLETRKAFKAKFVARGNPSDPRNRELLRGLLKEVMIRNTRSVSAVKLPPRYASTFAVEGLPAEAAFYRHVEAYVAEEVFKADGIMEKMQLRRLLEAVGSSHAAALGVLKSLSEGGGSRGEGAKRILLEASDLKGSAKAARVADMLKAMKDQAVVFVNHRATLEFLRRVLEARRIEHRIFQGGMTNDQKQQAVKDFREGCKVLLATAIGGEGHNLQFCHVLVNYDLPWNPMEIEQRIGRLHRIGQQSPVEVYNFCAAGSIEERILDVLDRKINMFELVIGEIDMILGRLQEEREFADMVFDLWLKNPDEDSRDKAFDELAASLKKARREYDKIKSLDDKLFREDFGM